MSELNNEDEVRAAHRRRVEAMRRDKERQLLFRRRLRKYALPGAGILAVILLLAVGIGIFHKPAPKEKPREEISNVRVGRLMPVHAGIAEKLAETGIDRAEGEGAEKQSKVYKAQATDATLRLGEGDTVSEYAVLIDLGSGNILAERNAYVRMNPASMTKILTALVAAEQIKDLNDTLTITREITDYGYIHDCSSVGFEIGEEVSLKDLFYGAILPSGADAAVGLAVYVSGSQDAFVELMNQKLEELGLSKTAHFTNCVGVFDESHYCTTYDMAMIMEAAIDNDLCREVLSTRIYTTSKTEQHPEGIELSNWFIRRIEDKDSGGKVLGGKTGYVAQSGNCAASFAATDNSLNLVCVTANAGGRWRCIEDHVKLYKQFSQ